MTLLTIILILMSISLHELGHAMAMKKCGVQMKEICLLGMGKKLLSFKVKYFGDTPLTIRLLPLGAFVKPESNEEVSKLNYKQYCHISAAGICNNFLFSSFLLTICLFNEFSIGWLIMSVLLFLIGIAPKFTFHIIIPLGLIMLWLLLSDLLKDPVSIVKNSGAIVSIAEDASKHSTSLFKSIEFAAVCSFALGWFNCLPFYPLDGGQILSKTIRAIFPKAIKTEMYIRVISALPLLILVVLALGNDILKVIKLIF